jgi:tellurium resistance protein TerZ
MPKIEQNEHTPLNVTQQAKHRILAGLSWEPNPKHGLLDKIKGFVSGKTITHDLDLLCFAFDAQKNLIEFVSADTDHAASADGHIYHSGDDQDGAGEGDDEQISAELKNLGPDVHHLVFVVSVKSGQSLDQVHQPEIRLADGYSNHNFLVESLAGPEAKGQSAFIFARVYRQENGWMLYNISRFTVLPAPDGWPEVLAPHL